MQYSLSTDILKQEGVEIVFTYASAGLGHLRVMDALKDGLPEGINFSILNPKDNFMKSFHRLGSINAITRKIMEFSQWGIPSVIISFIFKNYLRMTVGGIKKELLEFIKKKHPKTLIIVATHFNHAHQIAWIKKDLEKEIQCRILLVVQVTDDSPQPIWYVEDADLTFVPSEDTKAGLLKFGKSSRFKPIDIKVIPYPLNLPTIQVLTKEEFSKRCLQVDPKSKSLINISLPVSGAAVGMGFSLELINNLHKISSRYFFNVVSRIAPYTDKFLLEIINKSFVKTMTSLIDREVVNLYEEAISGTIMLMEITKPSEQAFKAILSPEQKGGLIMLFTQPVGRQEYENLLFLEQRGLIPNKEKNENIWNSVLQNKDFTNRFDYRGLRLPKESTMAAEFINKCLEKGIFSKMLTYGPQKAPIGCSLDLGGCGVNVFWRKVAELVEQKSSYPNALLKH